MMYVLGKRITMLKRGQLDVVQFLRGLPRTVHYSKSFIVDCLYSTVSAAIVFKWAHVDRKRANYYYYVHLILPHPF